MFDEFIIMIKDIIGEYDVIEIVKLGELLFFL